MVTVLKDINLLEEWFKYKVKLWMDEVGWIIFPTETIRTQERQNELYARWRTSPWTVVTWVTHSIHQDWKAIDIAFYWNELYPTDISKWRYIADIAKKYWIDWWYDLRWNDKPHFQDNWILICKEQDMTTTDYKELLNDEISQWWKEIFSQHEWEWTLTEWEIKTLIEIALARFEDRIWDIVKEKLIDLFKNIA